MGEARSRQNGRWRAPSLACVRTEDKRPSGYSLGAARSRRAKKRAKEGGGDWVPQGLRGHGEEAAFDLKSTGEPPKVFSVETTRQDLKCYLGCYAEIR